MDSIIFMGPIFLLFRYLQEPTAVNGIFLAVRVFSVLAIIFILFPFHEFAHAFSAKRLGDDTAERNGRLTLNPFAHIDPMGALCMMFLPLGWAKPVPINPRNATRKISMRGFISLTAAAGPISNIILSLILVILAKIAIINADINALILGTGGNEMLFFVYWALMITAEISIFLAVFNLIPIPPLDGSKILMFFLSNKAAYTLEINANRIRLILLVSLILLPVRYNPLLLFIGLISDGIMFVLDAITFFIK